MSILTIRSLQDLGRQVQQNFSRLRHERHEPMSTLGNCSRPSPAACVWHIDNAMCNLMHLSASMILSFVRPIVALRLSTRSNWPSLSIQ